MDTDKKTGKTISSGNREASGCGQNQKYIEDHPQKLIEDHPQNLIEDHPQKLLSAESPGMDAMPTEPLPSAAKGNRKGWLGWVACALLAGAVIVCGIFFNSHRDRLDKTYAEGRHDIAAPVRTVGAGDNRAEEPSGNQTSQMKNAGYTDSSVANYVYYFPNDGSEVADNKALDALADKAVKGNAEIEITGYASNTGSQTYNSALSKKRADNIADYLIAHGVKKDHIMIDADGATDRFGDESHCRRVEIPVEYGA